MTGCTPHECEDENNCKHSSGFQHLSPQSDPAAAKTESWRSIKRTTEHWKASLIDCQNASPIRNTNWDAQKRPLMSHFPRAR
jgi:hypothetical protein